MHAFVCLVDIPLSCILPYTYTQARIRIYTYIHTHTRAGRNHFWRTSVVVAVGGAHGSSRQVSLLTADPRYMHTPATYVTHTHIHTHTYTHEPRYVYTPATYETNKHTHTHTHMHTHTHQSRYVYTPDTYNINTHITGDASQQLPRDRYTCLPHETHSKALTLIIISFRLAAANTTNTRIHVHGCIVTHTHTYA